MKFLVISDILKQQIREFTPTALHSYGDVKMENLDEVTKSNTDTIR